MIQLSDNQFIDADIKDIIDKLKLETVGLFYKEIDTPNNYMICCPFHKEGQERKPSMGIYKKDGTCHCFACQWVGSIQQLISNVHGYDDFGRYGEKWLIRNFTSVSVEEREDVELDFSRSRHNGRPDTIANSDSNTCRFVSEEELDKYRYIHPYMYERKLTDEIIEMFDVGYDRDTDSITFPVRDINGNTLFIARRSVCTKRFNYPQGVEKPVYGLYEISKIGIINVDRCSAGYSIYPNEIIICESIIDALTCWVYGKPAVALNGLGTEKQFETLRKFPCRHYILATDMDEAGLWARKKIKAELLDKLITEYRWDLRYAKDINDMSKEMFDNLREYIV